MWKRLKEFILKDVKDENEIKMYAVILRMTLLVMLLYYGVSLGNAVVMLRAAEGAGAVCGIALCIWLLWLTYHNRTRLAASVFSLSFMFLMLAHAHMFGTETSVFHFVYIQIVMLYVLDYLSLKWKIFWAGLAVLFRMGMYQYVMATDTLYTIGRGECAFWQGTHLITASVLLVVTVSAATQDFREMQDKLVTYNRKLKNIASIDPLTGLRNRRSALEYLQEEVERYGSGEFSALTIAIGDIDFFKRINDTYGHNYGDLVLKTLADLFKHFMKGKGRAARWGGEEFLVIFHNINGDDATEMLSELRHCIHHTDFRLGADVVRLTMTFGVSEYDLRKKAEDTIDDADQKLYRGKESGRDRIVY